LILKRLFFVLPSVRVTALTALTIAVLAACGGGGSSDSNSTSKPAGAGSANAGNEAGSVAASQKVTFLPPASNPQQVTPTGDATVDGIAFTNAVRHNVGYPTAIAVDNGLTTSSQNHASYLVANSTMGHYETAGLPGYTGASPFGRIAAVGFPNAATEVTISGDVRAFSSSLTAVQLIFDAPYHRMAMLADYARMGVGSVNSATWGAFNIDFGDQTTDLSSSQVVAYPYAGQTVVPTSWYAYEDPDPFASAPQYRQTNTGYPVTIQGKLFSKLSSVHISISDSGGNTVLCQLQTPENDSHLTSGAMCIPFAPLTASSTYTVHAVGVLTDSFATGAAAHPMDLTWSFTTASPSDAKAKAASHAVRPPIVQ
jgi:uncharacterized protein YkwD